MATPPVESFVSVRIVSVDFYMTKPHKDYDTTYSSFSGCAIDQVPIVRVFGTTPAGQKVCLHLHRVRIIRHHFHEAHGHQHTTINQYHQYFPYFFLPFDESTVPLEAAESYLQRLAASIDRAMDVSMGKFRKRRVSFNDAELMFISQSKVVVDIATRDSMSSRSRLDEPSPSTGFIHVTRSSSRCSSITHNTSLAW